MNFKSKHEHTISFSAEGFDRLLSKDWTVLSCQMASGRIVSVPRHKLTCLWSKTRDWRKVPYSKVLVKVINID